jgi:hypothetical protein
MNPGSNHAMWQFITKNELYGFIILHKIINVKIYIMDYVIWSNDWFFIVY